MNNMLIKFILMSITSLVMLGNAYALNQDYYLDVEINPEHKMLFGKANITPIENINIYIAGFQEVKLNGKKVPLEQKILKLKAASNNLISYQLPLGSYTAYSDKDNIVLSGAWYPQIDQLTNYHLKVNLPEAFKAISEADKITSKAVDYKRIEYDFSFPYLQDNLTLVASTQYQYQFKMYQGIKVETWFKQKNSSLADNYINHSIDYLKLYQKMLGKYPYKRFAIVESPLPSGFSMPSYTLLGSRVIALPFIVKTSLGHEILHQWFGNSVYVDYKHGNWAEGLTNYLADYYYAERQGKGLEFRKQILNQYMDYVDDDHSIPVRQFLSRKDKATSSIGYGKVALIFHQLSRYYGREKFLKGVQIFIKNNQYQKASWHDLQKAFETLGGEPLYEDFNHWLTRTDLPNIQVDKKAELEISQGKLLLNFSLKQVYAKDAPAYHLHVPIVLTYPKANNELKKQTEILHFTQNYQDFQLALSEPPLSIFIDPQYQLIRELDSDERIPDLAWVMGKKALLLVVNDDDKELYLPLVKRLGVKKIDIISPSKLNFERIKSHSLILAGKNNSITKMLFANNLLLKNVKGNNKGVELEVKHNPYNNEEIILLLDIENNKQASLAINKIRHYGKYNHLFLLNGVVINKDFASSENGIKLFEKQPSIAVIPSKTYLIDDIVSKFKGSYNVSFKASQPDNNRIIMMGEQHNLFEHHLNQLLLIKKLKQAGYKVAIGLEMFQQPYQLALDAYVAKEISEAEFLTQTKYFEKWRYDYNLYKPIIDYAVEQKLPMLALNIETDISKKVAKKGMLALLQADKKSLPESMDFDNSGYKNDLLSVFQLHQQMKYKLEDKDKGNFGFFMQSQVLWDESMAKTAAKFLSDNPEHVLVILAGNGHLRYRYGIADRLQRLSGQKPIVIVQDEQLDKNIADYVLITTPISGNLTPKIGVYLDTPSLDAASPQIKVTKVTEASVGAFAGLKKDDIILSIDGREINSFTDLKLALLYADTSSSVPVKIKRGDEVLEKLFDFSKTDRVHGGYSHGYDMTK